MIYTRLSFIGIFPAPYVTWLAVIGERWGFLQMTGLFGRTSRGHRQSHSHSVLLEMKHSEGGASLKK